MAGFLIFLKIFVTIGFAAAADLSVPMFDFVDQLNRMNKTRCDHCPYQEQSKLQVIKGKPAQTFWMWLKGEEFFKPVVKVEFPTGSCSASFVGPGVLVTAFHCIKKMDGLRFRADGPCNEVSGLTELQVNETHFATQKVYSVSGDNDVLVIYLSGSPPPSEHYVISKERVPHRSKVYFAGFSSVDEVELDPAKNSIVVTGEIVQGNKKKRWGSGTISGMSASDYTPKYFLEFVMTAPADEKTDGTYGISYGDSGGPLLHNEKLVGVCASHGVESPSMTRVILKSDGIIKRDGYADLTGGRPRKCLLHLEKSGIPIRIEK
jgi:hypothetical protein